MTGSDRSTTASAERPPVLSVAGLEVTFAAESTDVRAVRGVDLAVRPGEVLGVVGESGSGKSVSMLAVMGLLPSEAIVRGSVRLDGRELVGLDRRSLRRVRGRDIAMVFQDPMTSLNPVFTVGDQIVESVRVHHRDVPKRAARDRAAELLHAVGIPGARRRLDNYPHELSGGMRQRVVIAMGIANDPSVLIADEPTTALDVTVQAQILELLRNLCDTRGISIVLITHDLGVVSGLADEVVVMYAGRVAERGGVEDVFYRSGHPYTVGLLAAVPRIDDAGGEMRSITGVPPSLARLPSGCTFAPRCTWRTDACELAEPPLQFVGRTHSACLRADEVGATLGDRQGGSA